MTTEIVTHLRST